MIIRKKTQGIKNFLYEFSFMIENGEIVTKFPCFFSISIKCGKQFVQTKEQQKSIGNIIKCSQKLQFQTQIRFDQQNDSYEPKHATILIQIRSQKKPKQKLTIGVLNIQLTKAINNPQTRKLQKYMLEKSQNKEGFLNISISATFLKQFEPTKQKIPYSDQNEIVNSQYSKFSENQKSLTGRKSPSKQKLIQNIQNEFQKSSSNSKSLTPQSFAFKAIESQYWTPKQNHYNFENNRFIQNQQINKRLFRQTKPNQQKNQKTSNLKEEINQNNDLQVTFSKKIQSKNSFKKRFDNDNNINGLIKNQYSKFDLKLNNQNNSQFMISKQKICTACLEKSTKIKLMFKQFANKQNELKQNINQLENYFNKLNQNYQKQIQKCLQYQKKLQMYQKQVKTTRQKLFLSQENKKQKQKQITDLVLEVVQQKMNQYSVMQKQSQIQILKKNNNTYLKQIGIKQEKITNLTILINNKQQQLKILSQQLRQVQQDYSLRQTQYLIEIQKLKKGKQKKQIETMTDPEDERQVSKFQEISKVQRQCYELNYKVNEYAIYEQTLKDKIRQQTSQIQLLKQKNLQLKNQNKLLLDEVENLQKQIIKQEVEVEKIKKQQFSSKKNKSKNEQKQSTLPNLINHIANMYDTKIDSFSRISNLQQTIILLMERNKKLLKKVQILNEEKSHLNQKIAELSSGSNYEKTKNLKNQITQNELVQKSCHISQILEIVDYQKQDINKYFQEDTS